MKRPPVLKIDPSGFEQWAIENAQQRIAILDSAPTAAIPQIREGDIAYFNNKIYLVIDGVLKEFSVSSTA